MKLSEPKSAAADELRGGMTRARWLETLIDAAIAGQAEQERAPRRRKAAPPPASGPARGEPESATDIAAFYRRRRQEQR